MPQLHHQDSGLGIQARSERPAGHLPKGIHHMAGGGGCVPGTLETGPPGPYPSSGLPNHCRQTAVALAVPDALLLFNRSGSCVRCQSTRGSRGLQPSLHPWAPARWARTAGAHIRIQLHELAGRNGRDITCGRRRARRRWRCGHWNSLPFMDFAGRGNLFLFFR